MRGEKRQELGRPVGFRLRKARSHGIRILSHARGNLDTEVGRSLPDPESRFSR